MHQLRTSDQGDRMSDTTTEILPSRWDANASFWVQIIREHRDKYRNGAHAFAPAGAPATAAPTPVGWRESTKSGPLAIQAVREFHPCGACIPAPAAGLSEAGQNPS